MQGPVQKIEKNEKSNQKLQPFSYLYILTTTLVFLFQGLFVDVSKAQNIVRQWRSMETEHFRIHYPEAYSEWTFKIASRLEAIHETVTQNVGYSPDRILDIIAFDPLGMTNGPGQLQKLG